MSKVSSAASALLAAIKAAANIHLVKTILAPYRPALDCTSAMRLSIQPESYGAEKRAGSPIADHKRRPNRSLKPAIGFQATSGVTSTPRLSQPFHGKSLSFTVRMKTGE